MASLQQILTNEVALNFCSKRIVSFLYFGSNAFNKNNKFSDYDFLLLLDHYSESDLPTLRKILSKNIFKNLDINLNLIYKNDLELRRIDNFQLRSLRPDFCIYLKCAIPLIGKNYFYDLHINIPKNKLIKYINFKIQEYYGRCDKSFLQEKSTEKLKVIIKKYAREMLRMLLVRKGKISILQIHQKTYKELYKVAIKSKYIPINIPIFLESNDLTKIEQARRAIYNTYLSFFTLTNSEKSFS